MIVLAFFVLILEAFYHNEAKEFSKLIKSVSDSSNLIWQEHKKKKPQKMGGKYSQMLTFKIDKVKQDYRLFPNVC